MVQRLPSVEMDQVDKKVNNLPVVSMLQMRVACNSNNIKNKKICIKQLIKKLMKMSDKMKEIKISSSSYNLMTNNYSSEFIHLYLFIYTHKQSQFTKNSGKKIFINSPNK